MVLYSAVIESSFLVLDIFMIVFIKFVTYIVGRLWKVTFYVWPYLLCSHLSLYSSLSLTEIFLHLGQDQSLISHMSHALPLPRHCLLLPCLECPSHPSACWTFIYSTNIYWVPGRSWTLRTLKWISSNISLRSSQCIEGDQQAWHLQW